MKKPYSKQHETAGQLAFTRASEDDGLSAFERMTVRFGRWGLFVAGLSFVAASLAAYFIYQQFAEMNSQTQILSASAQRARIDGNESSKATMTQLGLLQKQLTQQNTAMRIDERAWISAGFIDGVIVEGKPLRLTVHLKNTGKTPALSVADHIIAERVDKGHAPNFSLETPGTGFSVISPNAELLATKDMTGGKPLVGYQLIASKDVVIYLHGTVWYSDIFRHRHWTRFCYFFSPEESAFKVCNDPSMRERNDTDADQQ